MAVLGAFFDANVLYPSELRNFLMHLALTGLFRAKWSASVHEEWISNLLRNRPDLTRQQLERTRMLMDKNAAGALVTGYEHLIASLNLPDPNDRHVLAAAILGHAQIIVTMNLKDFPTAILEPYGLKAQHPDDFVMYLFRLSPHSVAYAAETHRQSLKNPLKTMVQYLDTLYRQGLKQTVSALREYMP